MRESEDLRIILWDIDGTLVRTRRRRRHRPAYTVADLAAHRPDAVLPDLTDTELLLRTLEKL
ncbi:MAG: hypothetical protein QOJ70_621 [Acidobacteriota bacterium]|jgi:phosphoglycolate phosphatase-like HAD superfamily hydrolase|nr:hypothetical protein [Acidobacteriota bacterium]